ncbi:MAG: SET domain-containing protein [Alphaproteobacteria bacterium]|nr:SET domain-containing protein [Alphaproteobacteria bacterium]
MQRDALDGADTGISSAIIVLRPSTIEGVGCFTLAPIRAGQIVKNLWDDEDVRFVGAAEVPPELVPLHKRYCIESADGYWCPLDFRRMSVGWYLNHSDAPNLASRDGGNNYLALRDIAAGEELTIDYRKLDDAVDNSM